MVIQQAVNIARQALGTRQPNMADQALMDWIAKREQDLRAGYEHFDKYYRGEQGTRLTDRLRQFINQRTGFRDNFCEVVVDVMAERLNVIGFESGDDDLDEWLWDVWQINRMDAKQITVHTEAPKKGDAYILVDWDIENKRPRFTFQDASMVIPRYNASTGLLDLVSKKWTETVEVKGEPRTRLNLYFPDRVEKFVAAGNSSWIEHRDEGETEWPLKWTTKDGKPLGVAVIHFRNKPGADDFGISELENVTPMQDVLNKSFIDLILIEDVMASPQRWMIGVEKPSSGDFKTVPGAVWDLQSDDPASAKVGQFEPANIDGILKAIETTLQHIAGRSRTPQHLFHISGDFPSGEAMKTAEAGLVSKVRQRQVDFGNSWEDSLMLAMRLQERFGTGVTFTKGAMPETIWKDPETRNQTAFMAELEGKERLGVTQEQILRELGYDQEQIEQMAEDREAQKVRDSNLGAELIRNFSRGEV